MSRDHYRQPATGIVHDYRPIVDVAAPRRHRVSCAKLSGGCCMSCHEDEELGYGTLDIEEREVAPGVWVLVRYCCRKSTKVEDRADKLVTRLGGSGRRR